MYSVITLLLSALLVVGSLYLFKKCTNDTGKKYLRILVVIYCLIGFVRYFLSDSFVETVLDGTDIFESLLRMFYHISCATLPMAVFFERRIFRNIAIIFNLPIALVAAVAFERTFHYFTASGGGGYYIAEWQRAIFYIAELVLAISIPLILYFGCGHRMNFRSGREWFNAIAAFIGISWMMMPAYAPQSIIGYTEMSIKTYGPMHLGWILYMVVECLVIIWIFRNRSSEEKHELCIFLTIAQMYHTMSIFLRGFTLSRIPLQLCCIAAFLYFIAIVFKNRTLFDFCYVSNTVGAIIAIAIAAFSSGALSFWNVHYMQEHTFVIVVPIVAYAFGLFPRLETSALKHILCIFMIYFGFCLAIGSVFNIVSGDGGYAVNYFYMFNASVAVEYVPFAGFVSAIKWNVFGMELCPILVLIVFSVFLLLCVLFFYMNRGIYLLKDRIAAKTKG